MTLTKVQYRMSNDLAPIDNPSFTGNVGVNTSSPTSALDVNGEVRISSGDNNRPLLLESTDTRVEIELRDNSTTGTFTNLVGAEGNKLLLRGGQSNGVEIDPSGVRVRANNSARLMNTVAMPLAWGAEEANTPSANSAVFSLFEAEVSNRLVDLGSENLDVPNAQVPDANTYQHGYLREASAEGNVSLSHPQLNTMLKTTVPLTSGLCNSTWSQHNACWDDGMREGFVAFSENNANGVEDNSARVVVMRSRDGISWTREEVDLGFPCAVFGHCVYGGFQILIVRDESTGANQGKFYLYGRQLAQRVELKALRNTGAGDNRYSFTHADLTDTGRPLMLYETALVQFSGLPTNLAGVNLNTEDECAYRSPAQFQFRAASNFTGSFTHSGTFEMNVRESDWFHITLDGGQTLGEALESAGGGVGEPVMVHGISMAFGGTAISGSPDVFASRGDFYVGVSGGQFNAAVARLQNLVDENNKGSVAWVTEIPGANAALNEVTVQTFAGETKLCGFIRTSDQNAGQTVPAAFWSTDDGDASLGTVSLTNLPTGAFEDSPIPLCVLGDDIVAAASLERGDNGQRGSRRMVLLKASIADAFFAGASAFADQVIPFEWAEYKNQTLTGGETGAGVSSITPWGNGTDKTVAVFWNQEANTNDPYLLDTVTQIMATKVGFDPNSAAYYGAEQVVWGNVPKPEWRLHLRGTPAVANSSVVLWSNVDRQSSPHGYNSTTGVVTFPVSGTYRVSAQMSYEANTGSNYLLLRNEGNTTYVGGNEVRLAAAYTGGSVKSMGSSDCVVRVKGGDTMVFKVTAAGGATSTSSTNYAQIELLEMH